MTVTSLQTEWKKVFGGHRRWRSPKNLVSPNKVGERIREGIMCFEALEQMPLVVGAKAVKVAANVAYRAASYAFPFFYVAPELWEAVGQTDPPNILDFSGNPLPFPGFYLVFPQKAIQDTDGDYYDFVGVALGHVSGTTNGAPNALYLYATTAGYFGPNIHAVVPVMDGKVSREWLREQRQEGRALDRTAALVYTTLAIMSTRPDYIAGGQVVRKRKKGRLHSETAQVRIVGKGYRARRVSGERNPNGSGRVVAMHWRRGHFHTVRYGLGKKQARVDWFEPVLVNATCCTAKI